MVSCFKDNPMRQNNLKSLRNLFTIKTLRILGLMILPGGRLIAEQMSLFIQLLRAYFQGRIGKKRF